MHLFKSPRFASLTLILGIDGVHYLLPRLAPREMIWSANVPLEFSVGDDY